MFQILVDYGLPISVTLVAGIFSGFAAGLFGIGGGFIVVPALMVVLPLLGSDNSQLAHVAVGTSLATIIPTSIRSVRAHAKRGVVDFGILKSWAAWTALGASAGVLAAGWMSGSSLVLIFGCGVLIMSLHFLTSLTRGLHMSNDMPGGAARVGISSGLGAFSALLGIGGGTIAVIVMTMCGRTIHQAVATAAGLGAIIAVPGMIGFALIGLNQPGLPMGSIGYVNVVAAVGIVAASIFTAPIGAAAAHKLSPVMLRRVFGIYLVVIGAIMVVRSLMG